MADVLKSTLTAGLQWSLTETLDQSSVIDAGSVSYIKSPDDGTGSSQADTVWHDERTVTATTNDDLDLTALTRSIYGSTVTTNFVKVKAIVIKNLTTTATYKLTVKADATNGYTGWCDAITTSRVTCGPDSAIVLSNIVDGQATSGSNKVLRIYNGNAASVTYEIAIIGTTA